MDFPFHAAGYHLSRLDDKTALDRVVSSYNSSIKAMWYGRKQWNATHFLNQSKIARVVTMQHKPGAGQLVHVESEIKVLEEICSSVVGECVRPELVHGEFSATVENCTIFHFAGHGDSKVGSPLKSLLLLRDWQSSPFTVADIMNMEIGAPQRFLVYLLAGQVECWNSQRWTKASISLARFNWQDSIISWARLGRSMLSYAC